MASQSLLISVETLTDAPVWERRTEIVERKGRGHPDTICDALSEELSVALCRYYHQQFGVILHHNVDKLLLVGGAAQPRFGGGVITQPIELFYGGRATLHHMGVQIPIEDLIHRTSQSWFRKNIPDLDPYHNIKAHCELRGGSSELITTFNLTNVQRSRMANDTSCGVGYAPLSKLEQTVLSIEMHLNSKAYKHEHPEVGTDIKVMGTRLDNRIDLSIACAMIDRHLLGLESYKMAMEQIKQAVTQITAPMGFDEVRVSVNHADNIDRGDVYLTVSGTSAEGGDDGETGRGNRANGLISPYRPMTMEAVAGKNPLTHVGKLYNVTARRIASALVEGIAQIHEAECFLVSRIGSPIDRPQLIDIRVRVDHKTAIKHIRPSIDSVIELQLSEINTLWSGFINHAISIY